MYKKFAHKFKKFSKSFHKRNLKNIIYKNLEQFNKIFKNF